LLFHSSTITMMHGPINIRLSVCLFGLFRHNVLHCRVAASLCCSHLFSAGYRTAAMRDAFLILVTYLTLGTHKTLSLNVFNLDHNAEDHVQVTLTLTYLSPRVVL